MFKLLFFMTEISSQMQHPSVKNSGGAAGTASWKRGVGGGVGKGAGVVGALGVQLNKQVK